MTLSIWLNLSWHDYRSIKFHGQLDKVEYKEFLFCYQDWTFKHFHFTQFGVYTFSNYKQYLGMDAWWALFYQAKILVIIYTQFISKQLSCILTICIMQLGSIYHTNYTVIYIKPVLVHTGSWDQVPNRSVDKGIRIKHSIKKMVILQVQ